MHGSVVSKAGIKVAFQVMIFLVSTLLCNAYRNSLHLFIINLLNILQSHDSLLVSFCYILHKGNDDTALVYGLIYTTNLSKGPH